MDGFGRERRERREADGEIKKKEVEGVFVLQEGIFIFIFCLPLTVYLSHAVSKGVARAGWR